ncbi:histidine-containing phosphotransfer protein 5-like isoform X1 [Cucurbita moschata]|uniref:Histidine-containing phosphotransfer protein n=1 Tax=Cucurbita moschata TaxID=3662 RepID=A0A6J1H1A8_CUCMO|nr:histidine-containing phosphotransfer protein 5-like isoform X1 [Cucurbita moschata]XP_022957710.1 histidine-containing phosphotransfer protein 5-like isoform X1 [Cucurbita moschata]XP_022957711.1 histidine-containing phosphotransfer protein 5-like isoform X1 [Cucurbita moschata]
MHSKTILDGGRVSGKASVTKQIWRCNHNSISCALFSFLSSFHSREGILIGLLQDYVQSLLNEKIIDERFSQIRTKLEEPDFIQLINVYLNDVESRLSEFSCFIDSVDVNFSKLSLMAHKIEEKSTRIGARHMKLASIHLIQACDKEDHKLVSQSLCWMKHEFINTRNKLQPVLQMEQRILRLMSKQT